MIDHVDCDSLLCIFKSKARLSAVSEAADRWSFNRAPL